MAQIFPAALACHQVVSSILQAPGCTEGFHLSNLNSLIFCIKAPLLTSSADFCTSPAHQLPELQKLPAGYFFQSPPPTDVGLLQVPAALGVAKHQNSLLFSNANGPSPAKGLGLHDPSLLEKLLG